MWKASVSGLLLLAAFAGCAGDPAEPQAAVISSQPGFGDVAGLVLDGEMRPVEGAHVSLRGPSDEREATTDAMGAFAFESVVAAPYVLDLYHPRFEAYTRNVLVKADQANEVEAVLALLPQHLPYRVHYSPLRGHYDCAAEAIILTGDCMILWENVTGAPSPFTEYRNWFTFNVSSGWTSIVLELEYESVANNQFDGMRLYLGPVNESRNPAAHRTKFAVAEGSANPLRIQLEASVAHATADEWHPGGSRARFSLSGGELIGLVYPRGHLADAAGDVCQPDDPSRCFLGVGTGLNIDFTAYATVFYNGEPVPKDFTQVPT